MSKFNWVNITKDDVIKAINKFLLENPQYPEPRTTFLVYEGKRLPAKHIRGMAYTVHYGIEISKADFGGGFETVKFFERLGFLVEYQGTTIYPKKKTDKKKIISKPASIREKSSSKAIKTVENEVKESIKKEEKISI